MCKKKIRIGNKLKIGFMIEIEIDDMEDAISKFLQDDFTVEKE